MTAKPFIKCLGGKTALAHNEILPRLPEKIGTYFEPFLGGGAVFFALAAEKRFKKAVLGDLNRELIETCGTVRNELEGLIRKLKKHVYDKGHYYEVRALNPWKIDEIDRAARFIYLNRTGFNGLYRVNKKGQFNVPFGRYKNPTICDEENLRAVAAVLRGVTLVMYDFEYTIESAKSGDTVYFDPPYMPVSKTSNFTAYSKVGFKEDDQKRLAAVARQLDARGVHVLVSNSDTPLIQKLYKGFKIDKVRAPRRINSNGDRRGDVSELLISGRW